MKEAAERRRKELAAIHAGAKALGMDEETRRGLLEMMTGKRSAADLTARERREVIDALRQRGFGAKPGAPARPAVAVNPQAAKARALWRDLHELGEVDDPSDRALDAFVAGERGPGVGSLRFCGPEQLNHVIEALKDWCARVGFKVPDTRDGGRKALDALVEAQWRRLQDLGVFRTGRFARLDTWLKRHAGVMAPHFMSREDAEGAVRKLGEWIRRVKAGGEA